MVKISRSIELMKLAHASHRLNKVDDDRVLKNARIHLSERMGRLRGLPQKIGQILSMSSDESLADDFNTTTNAAEPLPFCIIEKILEKSWGRPIMEVLSSIEHEAQAASLGQVHKAVLKTGERVAIKVRYPEIEEAILSDLKLLGWISLPVGGFKKGFDLKAYQEALFSDLENELDYDQELSFQKEYKEKSKNLTFLKVPRVFEEFSSQEVLVAEWLDGETIDEVVKHWTEQNKRKLGNHILKHFAEMFFVQGIIHADPHAGNYRFRMVNNEPQIVLYDFGCVFKPKMKENLYLLKLIQAIRLKGDVSPFPLFLSLGFKADFLEPMRAKLPALCQVVFEPFVEERPFSLQQSSRSERVADILGEDRWNFRMAGPANLIFLMRVFAGIDFYLRKIEVPVIWSRSLEEPLQILGKQLSELEIVSFKQDTDTFSGLAKYLYVHVKKNGVTKVKLTLPARSVDNLEELLEPDIKGKIIDRKIDLKELIHKVRENGYRPMDLFKLDDGNNSSFSVWLS